MTLKWIYPSQKSLRGRERPRLSAVKVLWMIRNFTMLAIKSAKNSMRWLNKKRKTRNHWRMLSKPSDSNVCWSSILLPSSPFQSLGFNNFSSMILFFFANAYCFQRNSLWVSWSSTSSIIRFCLSLPVELFWSGKSYFKFIDHK